MMIKILPSEIVSLIAAGEVIHGPKDVLKELIENSLDAKADKIDIELVHGGLEKILVRDNGMGLSKSDLPLAIEKYATSKLEKVEDLYSLKSFGFRGEGLHSIVTISNFTIKSRTENAPLAYELVSQLPKKESHIHPCAFDSRGTEVICSHLFAPMPLRRQLFKSPHLEFKKSFDRVRALLLIHTCVDVSLKHNNNIVLRLLPSQNLLDRCLAAYPETKKERWLEIEWFFDMGSIQGWYYPESTKGLEQIWYVNHRLVAQSQFLKLGQRFVQQGILILSLKLDNNLIDYNMHPQKHAFGYTKEEALLSSLSDFFQEWLGDLCAKNYFPDLQTEPFFYKNTHHSQDKLIDRFPEYKPTFFSSGDESLMHSLKKGLDYPLTLFFLEQDKIVFVYKDFYLHSKKILLEEIKKQEIFFSRNDLDDINNSELFFKFVPMILNYVESQVDVSSYLHKAPSFLARVSQKELLVFFDQKEKTL